MPYYKDKKGNLEKFTEKALASRNAKDYKFVGNNLREVEAQSKKSTKRGKK